MSEQQNTYNFNPEIWGPKGWFFLDTIFLSYPNNPTDIQKEHFANFIYSIGNILPCLKCRNHYKEHINMNPLTDEHLQNRETLTDWWLKIHNMVRLSTESPIITKKDFIKYYNNIYVLEHTNNRNMVRNIIYLCVFLILIIWFKDIIIKKYIF